jgi:hypothetical protein
MPYPTPEQVPDDEVRAYGGPPPRPAAKRSSTALGISIVLAMLSLCLLSVVTVVIIGSNADRDGPRPTRIEQGNGPAIP